MGAEKAMAPRSSILAWKITWTEEPGRLQSMGSLRVRDDWATSLSLFTFMHWRRKWQPTPVFLPGESQRQWAPVYGVAQSRTRLKQLSSSRSSSYKNACVLSRFSHDQLFGTPWTVACQAPLHIGCSRQEYWSGLPFPSPMHESEKWKWSLSVVSNS